MECSIIGCFFYGDLIPPTVNTGIIGTEASIFGTPPFRLVHYETILVRHLVRGIESDKEQNTDRSTAKVTPRQEYAGCVFLYY